MKMIRYIHMGATFIQLNWKVRKPISREWRAAIKDFPSILTKGITSKENTLFLTTCEWSPGITKIKNSNLNYERNTICSLVKH